jgi:hypothetical protein
MFIITSSLHFNFKQQPGFINRCKPFSFYANLFNQEIKNLSLTDDLIFLWFLLSALGNLILLEIKFLSS